ncbi:hypothetical protein [Rhodobacteraceae bacterium DSL-40]|uniref:hypothetical protein n=1 Tax=Amaricoccus sp. B4 TaxID=3368557 RepID=UPI000DAC36BE
MKTEAERQKELRDRLQAARDMTPEYKDGLRAKLARQTFNEQERMLKCLRLNLLTYEKWLKDPSTELPEGHEAFLYDWALGGYGFVSTEEGLQPIRLRSAPAKILGIRPPASPTAASDANPCDGPNVPVGRRIVQEASASPGPNLNVPEDARRPDRVQEAPRKSTTIPLGLMGNLVGRRRG